MASFLKWLKTFMFGSVKEEMIQKIQQTDLSSDVKQDLTISIMRDQPEKFMDKLADVPPNIKDEFMTTMMRASQLYVRSGVLGPTGGMVPQIEIPQVVVNLMNCTQPKSDVDIAKDVYQWKQSFQQALDEIPAAHETYVVRWQQKEHERCVEAQNEAIYISRLIPSEQFVPMDSQLTDEEREKLSHFVNRRDQILQNWNYQKQEHKRCLEAQKNPDEQIIHTGKLIPSGQFKPISAVIPHKVLDILPPLETEEGYLKRLIERYNFRLFREAQRFQCQEHERCLKDRKNPEEQVIHTGKLIPSGQFKPIHTSISHKTLIIPPVTVPTASFVKRLVERYKLRRFIETQRSRIRAQQQFLKDEHQRCLDAQKDPTAQVIHTGKLIPSGQFKPVESEIIYTHFFRPSDPPRDWKRAYGRVMSQFKLKCFIQERRQEIFMISQVLEAQEAYAEVLKELKFRQIDLDLQHNLSIWNEMIHPVQGSRAHQCVPFDNFNLYSPSTPTPGSTSTSVSTKTVKCVTKREKIHKRHHQRFRSPRQFISNKNLNKNILNWDRKWNQHY